MGACSKRCAYMSAYTYCNCTICNTLDFIYLEKKNNAVGKGYAAFSGIPVKKLNPILILLLFLPIVTKTLDLSLLETSFTTTKLTGTLQTFFTAYPWYSRFSNYPSSFATFITNTIQLGMDYLFPLPINLARNILQSGSILNVQWLSKLQIAASKCGNITKLQNLELHLYKPIIYAPKP